MGCTPSDELSVEEAKARLIAAAEELSLAGYVKRRPYTALMLACAAGALFGVSPRLRKIVTKGLMRGGMGLF
ncbi:MAG: hypothetical protein HY272_09820 [Gammaproteobacteria bacterium]|nr:hypothetical protein [Gammaproteobacteria bacterium]